MTAADPQDRRRRIAQILARESIRSQTELAARLSAEGTEVTQATLSRDLLELRAEKVRRGRHLVYTLPERTGPASEAAHDDAGAAETRLRQVAADLLVGAEAGGELVVLRTPPGAAGFLAAALDRAAPQEVAGTVAGDDTILVITRQGHPGRQVADHLLALSEGHQP